MIRTRASVPVIHKLYPPLVQLSVRSYFLHLFNSILNETLRKFVRGILYKCLPFLMKESDDARHQRSWGNDWELLTLSWMCFECFSKAEQKWMNFVWIDEFLRKNVRVPQIIMHNRVPAIIHRSMTMFSWNIIISY